MACTLDGLIPPVRCRVGVAWAGRDTHAHDHRRSVKLAQFAPLFARDETCFVALQKAAPLAQLGSYFGPAPLLNLAPQIADFEDTLAILENVEHLVSVDIAVAHLAGACGVACSLILPYAPDWRWLLRRSDTPWYPSVKRGCPPRTLTDRYRCRGCIEVDTHPIDAFFCRNETPKNW